MMKAFALSVAISACLLVAGCYGVPKEAQPLQSETANFSFQVKGGYQAIADCSLLGINATGYDLIKFDLTSMETSQLIWDSGQGYRLWEINFRPSPQRPGFTSVEAHVPPGVFGSYRDRLAPIIEGCAEA